MLFNFKPEKFKFSPIPSRLRRGVKTGPIFWLNRSGQSLHHAGSMTSLEIFLHSQYFCFSAFQIFSFFPARFMFSHYNPRLIIKWETVDTIHIDIKHQANWSNIHLLILNVSSHPCQSFPIALLITNIWSMEEIQ